MDNQLIISKIDDHTWEIYDGEVRFFLLEGDARALLIDSGMNVKGVKAIAESFTNLPVELLNTHGDGDHTGGNSEFDSFYMHPAEASNFYKTQKILSKNRPPELSGDMQMPASREIPGDEQMPVSQGFSGDEQMPAIPAASEITGEMIPVWDGDVIDLGARPLKIIEMPGHTPGSIAVLDINFRRLFSGDPIQQDGEIFMFGIQREPHAYIISLKRLKEMRDRFDLIYPSHAASPVEPSLIDKLIDGMERILAGEIEPEKISMFQETALKYDLGFTAFLMDED